MTRPLAEKLLVAESKTQYIAKALQDPSCLSGEILDKISRDMQFLSELLVSVRSEIESGYAIPSLGPDRLRSTIVLLARKDPRSALLALLDRVISVTGAERGLILVKRRGKVIPLVGRGWSISDLRPEDRATYVQVSAYVMKTGRPLVNEVPSNKVRPPAASFVCLPIPGLDAVSAAILVESEAVSLVDAACGAAAGFLESLAEAVNLTSTIRKAIAPKRPFPQIVGNDPAFLKELGIVERAARTDVPVLIQGESGTGKELVARALHEASPRSGGPFLPVNCSGLPESILDSELFGHEKGAFTGATSTRDGILEATESGTVFLDEIADMSPSLQAKLLRFIQFGEVRRIGSSSVKRVDVRVVAATNRDLELLVSQGKFREDLYYRLNVVSSYLPPLRERRSDILLLVDHFLALHGAHERKLRLSPSALEAMVSYDYPGNVRELENAIRRLVALSSSAVVTRDQLPAKIRASADVSEVTVPRSNVELKRAKARARKLVADRLERIFLIEALRESRGKITRAAELTGINRSLLHQMVAKHGIDARAFAIDRSVKREGGGRKL